jgi:hypothetical protein
MNEIHIHLHFHQADSGVLLAIDQLKEIVKMSTEEVNAALDEAKAGVDAANAKLDAVQAQFRKGIDEVILAIQQGTATPESTIEKLNALKGSVGALATNVDESAVQAGELDSLTPDTPPVP